MENRLLYLSQADVESVRLTMAEIIDLLKQRSRRKARAAWRCHPSLASTPARVTISSTPCQPTSRP